MWSAFLGGVSARRSFGPPTPRVSGFGKVDADAAFIANVRILPLKTSRWIDGGTLWPAKRDEGTVDRHAVVSETRVASEANLPQQ